MSMRSVARKSGSVEGQASSPSGVSTKIENHDENQVAAAQSAKSAKAANRPSTRQAPSRQRPNAYREIEAGNAEPTDASTRPLASQRVRAQEKRVLHVPKARNQNPDEASARIYATASARGKARMRRVTALPAVG